MMRGAAVPSAFLLACLTSVGLAQQVKLEQKYPEGSKRKTHLTQKSHQILTLAGMDIETQSETVITESTEVGKRNPDGTLSVRTSVDAMRVHVTAPGGIDVSFDSSAPAANSSIPQIAALQDFWKVLTGSSFSFTLGKDNKVIAVEGTQEVLNKANQLSPTAGEMAKGQVNPETLKRNFEQEHAVVPENPVAKGETWERTEAANIGGGQTLTFQKRYEYLGTVQKDGKTLDKIGVKVTGVTYAMDPNSQSPLKITNSNLKVDSSKGTILFDRKVGRAVGGESKTRITGDLTASAGGMDLAGSKLDLTLESESKILP